MKVIIISDIHDNLENLRKALQWAEKQKINRLLCCGDVTNSETIGFLSSHFSGEIFLVRGNCEIYLDNELVQYKNIRYLGRVGTIVLDEVKVGLCHEPFLIEKVLEANSESLPQIIFFGHTHKPWIEDRAGIKNVNPGSLGAVFQKGTFAFWDIQKGILELKVLEQI